MEKKNNIDCVILAGGKNTRNNGFNKSFIEIEGVKIIDRIINIVTPIFNNIIIITNNRNDYIEYNNIIKIEDLIKDIGPLGGIYTALKYSKKNAVFVFSCDMPYLNNRLILNQINKFENIKTDIIIPKLNNNIEPLHSIYSKNINKKLEDYLNNTNNYKVRDFFPLVETFYWELENSIELEKAFTNINKQ